MDVAGTLRAALCSRLAAEPRDPHCGWLARDCCDLCRHTTVSAIPLTVLRTQHAAIGACIALRGHWSRAPLFDPPFPLSVLYHSEAGKRWFDQLFEYLGYAPSGCGAAAVGRVAGTR